MDDKILHLKEEIERELSAASDLSSLDQLRVSYLGKKGSITALLKGMKDLAADQKKAFGADVNKLKEYAMTKVEEKTQELKKKQIELEIAAMPGLIFHLPQQTKWVHITPSPLFRDSAKLFSNLWALPLRIILR